MSEQSLNLSANPSNESRRNSPTPLPVPMRVDSALTDQSEEQPRLPTPYPEVSITADLALPISPKSIPAILATFKDDLDPEVLIKIIHSLLHTIEVRKEATNLLQKEH